MGEKLLSVCILFRHGARGPGDSELTVWEENDAVVTQWKKEELERLSSRGVHQISCLGQWFSEKYVGSTRQTVSNPKAFFRGSISDRAVESASDFVKAFNASLGFECSSLIPTPYVENADNYFRPWKVNPASNQVIKDKCASAAWAEKVEENREFLERISHHVKMKACYTEHLEKALLSMTHIAGLAECEMFWPNPEQGAREELLKRIAPEDWVLLQQLSCYVWQERYLNTGMEKELGGWIFLDMIQSLFDSSSNVSFFAGHDYTILVFLAVGNFIKLLHSPIEFGAYVVLELWEPSGLCGTPRSRPQSAAPSPALPDPRVAQLVAADTTTLSSKSANAAAAEGHAGQASTLKILTVGTLSDSQKAQNRVLRVVLNHRPFNRDGSSTGDHPVCEQHSVVLAELSMPLVKELVNDVVNALLASNIGLPAHWVMPQFD